MPPIPYEASDSKRKRGGGRLQHTAITGRTIEKWNDEVDRLFRQQG